MCPGDVFLCLNKGTRTAHGSYTSHRWTALFNEKVVTVWANSDFNGTINVRKVPAPRTKKEKKVERAD